MQNSTTPVIDRGVMVQPSQTMTLDYMIDFARRYHETRQEGDTTPIEELAESFLQFRISMDLITKKPEQLFEQN